MTKVRTKSAVLQARAVALAAAAFVFGVAFVVTGPKQTPELVVARSISFEVKSTIGSSYTRHNAALLYPEAQRYPWYTSAGYTSAQSRPRLSASVSLSPAKGAPPPAPVITKAPGSLTYDTSAHFGFTDQGQHDGFQCRLDSAPVAPCGLNGVSYGGLSSGGHCFEVWALNGSLRGPPSSFCWHCRPVIVHGQFEIGGNAPNFFYPGTSEALDLTITNPFKFAIKVMSISVTVEADPTKDGRVVTACPASRNLLVARPFSGSMVVPGSSSETLSALGVPQARWPVLTMPDLPTNQDACEGATFELIYLGRAAQL